MKNKKNKISKLKLALFSSAVFILLVSTLWLQQGCVGSSAPFAAMIVTSTPTLPPDYISDFETGTLGINPNLKNTNRLAGLWSANTYGGSIAYTATPNGTPQPPAPTPTRTAVIVNIPLNSIPTPIVVSNPGNGSNYAIHIACPLSGTGGYEADQLICSLLALGAPNYPYFDASSFTGIQFDLNIPAGDTNAQRVFQIGTDVTTPDNATGGICPPNYNSNCYNHYQVALPSGSTGGWVTKTYNWNQILYPSFGPTHGPDVSSHLTKFIFLQWAFSANGAVTISQTNFWVDNVKFLP